MSKEHFKSHIASSLGLCPIQGSNTPLVSSLRSAGDHSRKSHPDSRSFQPATSKISPSRTHSRSLKPSTNSSQYSPTSAARNESKYNPTSENYNYHRHGSENLGLLKPAYTSRDNLSSPGQNTDQVVNYWLNSRVPTSTTVTTTSSSYLKILSPDSVFEGPNMYPGSYLNNQTSQANSASFNVQQASQLAYHPQSVNQSGGILYPGQQNFFTGQSSAIPQPGMPFLSTLQPLQIPNNSVQLTPQQISQFSANPAVIQRNVAQMQQSANHLGGQGQISIPMSQFPQQPQHASSFSGISGLNPSSGVFGQPLGMTVQNQSLAPSSGGFENDADWRFRRSKEMFDQAQRSHQQQRVQDPYLKANSSSTFGTLQTPGNLGPLNHSGTFQHLQQPHHLALGKTHSYIDANLSQVNSASNLNNLAGLGQSIRNVGNSNPAYAATSDNLPSMHGTNRGPPPVSSRQNWSKFRSKSFDHEDLLTSNQSVFGAGSAHMFSGSHNPGMDHMTSTNHGPISDSLAGVSGSSGSSGGYGIPVDLAYKLHATHQPSSDSHLSHSIGTSAHSLHGAHASHASHELQRNKSVSFDIPSHVEPYLDFDEASKLAQMFPNCAECQKLEQDKLLYRQALRLRKNNSDKSLHEYMRSGLDPRASFPNPVEDRRLKDLAQLISETFSERLLEEERDRDSLYPGKSAYSRRADSDYGPSSLYTPVGQKIPATQRSLPGSSKWALTSAGDLLDDHVQMSPLSGYNSMLRSGKKRSGAGSGILRGSEYDSLPSYKDSSQYLNLEGLSLRGRSSSRQMGNSGRTARDLSLASGIGGPGSLSGGIGGTAPSGRHSAYASDMDSYLYDRERYGSVNLSRFSDSRNPPSHPVDLAGGGDRRRNLKDIRYSRDYEFIPRAEDMGYSGGGGGVRRSKANLSPTFMENHTGEMGPRRHSPRSRKSSDAYNSSSVYSRHPPSHRKGRSSSAREDELAYHRNDNTYMNTDFMDHQNPPPPMNASGPSSTRSRQSARRYVSAAGTPGQANNSSGYYNPPSHYNFGDERETYRRGSSSDSVERLSSPERMGGQRRSGRRFQGRNGEPLGPPGNDYRGHEDKIPPRRSTGFKDDPRIPGRNQSFGSGPTDQHPGGSKNKPNFGPPADNYSMNGSDRQKLSEVPPNHSTESGYSSQSQHTAMSRDDPRNGAGGMGPPPHMGNQPQARMRPQHHPAGNDQGMMGAQNSGPMPRVDQDSMGNNRGKADR